MNKIFCFIDQQVHVDSKLQAYLEELDARGDEVYLYTNIDDKLNDPGIVISEIDKAISREEENNSLVFMTNMDHLFTTIYRLYHRLFHRFVFYRQPGVTEYNLYGIYQRISALPYKEAENLYKPVYSNSSQNIVNTDCAILDYRLLLEENTDNFIQKPELEKRKYYHLDGTYYLFEPVLSAEKIVVDLSESSNDNDRNKFVFPGFDKLQYMAEFNTELLNNLFACYDNLSEDNIQKISRLLDDIEAAMKNSSYFVYHMTCAIIDDAAQPEDMTAIIRSASLLSFLMQVTKMPLYLNLLLQITISNAYLNCANRFYIWNQCKRYQLINSVSGDSNTGVLMKQLYFAALEGYQKELEGELTPIPKKERSEDTILVFTIQFLSEGHAPTRTTLERCYTLGKLLKKKIILINTREQYTDVGQLLLYHPTYGNVLEDYSKVNGIQYKDYVIPFYQPEAAMPDINIIRGIIKKIKEIKPSFIFSIGNGSMTADLCGKIVPQASIGVAFSTLPVTAATFSVIGRTIAQSEWPQLNANGYNSDNIIESTFTFELRQKKGTASREQFHIPKDRFILVTVGIRLDFEIDDNFIESMQRTFAWGTHIVFAGEFKKYDEYCGRYPDFKDHSTFIGYYDDILALMEICDLYVNPIRLGGGFSIIEAFHEGKPGVTVRYGDIATAAGEDFCVSNYSEMEKLIKRYIEDKEFYAVMVSKAKEREKVVTDSEAAMCQIISKIQNNRLFF